MKPFRKISLFLSIVICLAGCNTPYKCTTGSEDVNFNFAPVIHLASNKPVLYSSEFQVLKYNFSGLIAFRLMPDTDETRIVFLSETGLKLMEFNYKNGNINNTYCTPFADRKQVKKFIGKFLYLLINDPLCKSICFDQTNEKSTYFCRNHKTKVKTETLENQRINSCIIIKDSDASASYTSSEDLPDIIKVKMSHNTRINLKRVDNAFK